MNSVYFQTGVIEEMEAIGTGLRMAATQTESNSVDEP